MNILLYYIHINTSDPRLRIVNGELTNTGGLAVVNRSVSAPTDMFLMKKNLRLCLYVTVPFRLNTMSYFFLVSLKLVRKTVSRSVREKIPHN